MHFNVYDIFYPLNYRQYVPGDIIIIINTRLQRYKCVVALTLRNN